YRERKENAAAASCRAWAKAIASELDLSIYTINDRLRSARRKLGTFSSREAARILGDTEGQAPQSIVRKEIGIAQTSQVEDKKGDATEVGRGLSRSAWLTGGMLIMSLVIAIAALTLTLAGSEPAPSQSMTPV
ncbi:MAG: hypothetical protein P1U62_01660, partial [Alteraurantiacibacter sp. bin_em_oilr2.035]|nr:hypothetical protein [Alteraurantiacibacter sp. bin_em_oilr2.035]